MTKTNYKVYTGPTEVNRVADLLRQSGLTVTLEGTQHVYVEAESTDEVLRALRGKGYEASYRDVHETSR